MLHRVHSQVFKNNPQVTNKLNLFCQLILQHLLAWHYINPIFSLLAQTKRHCPSYLAVDVGMAGNRVSDSDWEIWFDLGWSWSQAHATFCHISGLGAYLTARYLTRSEFFSWLGKETNSSSEASPASFGTTRWTRMMKQIGKDVYRRVVYLFLR